LPGQGNESARLQAGQAAETFPARFEVFARQDGYFFLSLDWLIKDGPARGGAGHQTTG